MVEIRTLLVVIFVLLLAGIYCERFGYNNRFTCHCASYTSCDKTTGACSTGSCQKGWSGPSCHRQNVALNKPATQSSYYRYSYPDVSDDVMSGYAVDGDRSHGLDLGLNSGQSKCVDMTGRAYGTVMGWWSVDLQQTYHLHTIKIYHRDRFLHRFTGTSVYIIDEYGKSTKCYQNTRKPTSSEFTISCNGTGRYLNFTQSTGEHILNLCEVEVYVCSKGTFGVNCSRFCDDRHCRQSSSCDHVTGYCEGGCENGWQGDDCLQCSTGYYGSGCNKSCSHRKCKQRSYNCDHVTGKCSNYGCQPGWTGGDCTNKCSTDNYGSGCSKRCSDRKCKQGSSNCDHVTGYCNGGCKDGWTRDDCTKKCSTGYYGSGCIKRCSHRKCKYSSNCDHVTGKCSNYGCQPGWTGDDCTNKCPRGSYGINCEKNCSKRHCKGSTVCNRFLGECKGGCQPGWTDDDCTKECPRGSYGINCEKNCSERHCKGSTSCFHTSGRCRDGCQPGWTDDDCTKECESGFYGDDCKLNCSDRKCLNMTSLCDHVTGQCNGGCIEEYYGMDCSVFKEKMVTTSGFPTGITVSIIIAVVVVFIVCLLLIVVIRRRKTNKSDQTPSTTVNRFTGPSTSAVPGQDSIQLYSSPDDSNIYINVDTQGQQGETPGSDYYNFDVTFKGTENFLKEFEKLILDVKNKNGFQQMYEDIPDGFTSSYSISQLPENRNKNRFKDYYPYDSTRVILEKQHGDPHSDFINANYITGWKKPKAYIAAQGATQVTLNDFVRMIWEQKCPKVVMLTNVYEMGKIKCERYWPEKGNEQFGDIILSLEEEKVRADYTIRQIIMTKGNNCHKFYHFHYTSWPDHDVPKISNLLDFLYTVNTCSSQSDHPLLIHCSAGVGRTGTYLAIDIGLKQGEDRGSVDVIYMINKMRDERKGMIQTYAQLQCVYESLLEGLTYGNTCKNVTEFVSGYRAKSNNMVMGRLSLSSQYRDLIRFRGENKAITSNVLIDGVASTACLLPSWTSVRGMLLDELKDHDTQSLWKLILHEQCSLVVCLLDDKNKVLCPPLGKKEVFESLTLERKNEEMLGKSLSMVTVSACLNTTREEKSVKVFMLNMKNMKKLKSVAHQMKALLDQVNIHDSTQYPVAVFSSVKDCGLLFCLLRNIVKRVKLDEEVEIFYNVRKLYQQSSSLIKSKEDYMEIFKFVSDYTKSQNIYENY